MRKVLLLILLMCFYLTLQLSCSRNKDLYLGQKPPGEKPDIFVPGIISTENSEGCIGFSNDGKVLVFNRLEREDTNWTYIPIYVMELKDGKWTNPIPVPFQKQQNDDNFTVAPNGKTLYFQSNRSTDHSKEPSQYSNIWKVIKTVDGWSEPIMLKSIENLPLMGGYPSVTSDGTVYLCSSVRKGLGKTDIYKSTMIEDKYSDAENLGAIINSEYKELDSFIAPDESYLILCSDRPGGYGQYDLYITFKKSDDSWTELVNMGPNINSVESVTRPSVTPDGKYFFFCKHFEL